ncbi:MAG: mechanosensitive ion channel family protein [Burkholderiaceae bacterium]|jgi:miniconductance mechanosensitive channel|nr:mechanosensitive ion channel family protein [Burkholderiaceae bacterium]
MQYQSYLSDYPVASMLLTLSALVAVSGFANFVVKRFLLYLVRHALRLSPLGKDDLIVHNPVISRLANIIPALVFTLGIPLVPSLPAVVSAVTQNLASAFIVLTLALAITGGLDTLNAFYMRRPDADARPIKGYLQLLKIVVYLLTTILIVSILIDKSPVILLSGLGAMAAVLLLVFQDTLLSLVASIQLSSNDMVRVGDWIEVPNLNADGEIIDLALHTVKVRNWDMTVTTLPTRRLISDPFKNWRFMQQSGGRRIKRSLFIDQRSIHFLTESERQRVSHFGAMQDYMAGKESEWQGWNSLPGDTSQGSTRPDARRLTNIGAFRAYVHEFLRSREDIHGSMTVLVRQMEAGPHGLPLEIYCFTSTTEWSAHEATQSDIFEHLYALMPEFGLRAYQMPSGHDFHEMHLQVNRSRSCEMS